MSICWLKTFKTKDKNAHANTIVQSTFINIRSRYRQSHKSLWTHIVTQVRWRFVVASWSLARWMGLGWLYASQLFSSLIGYVLRSWSSSIRCFRFRIVFKWFSWFEMLMLEFRGPLIWLFPKCLTSGWSVALIGELSRMYVVTCVGQFFTMFSISRTILWLYNICIVTENIFFSRIHFSSTLCSKYTLCPIFRNGRSCALLLWYFFTNFSASRVGCHSLLLPCSALVT